VALTTWRNLGSRAASVPDAPRFAGITPVDLWVTGLGLLAVSVAIGLWSWVILLDEPNGAVGAVRTLDFIATLNAYAIFAISFAAFCGFVVLGRALRRWKGNVG
jgi:hypothetical protein